MKDLTKGNITKVLFAFAIPIFFSNILQLTYSLVDTRIVGSVLGENALAAVGATTSLSGLLLGFLQGLTNGFAVLAAYYFGAADKKGFKKCVATSFLIGIIFSVVMTIASLVFLKPLLRILHTPDSVMDMSYSFIFVIFAGMTASMLYNVSASLLRAIGDTITPLIFLALSVGLNIVLDFFFLINLHLGVRGAAIATVLSQVLCFLGCFIYMNRRYEIFRLKSSDFKKLEKNMIKQMLKSGLSMGFMYSLVNFGTVALQTAINSLGTTIIVAHTAARKITELYMMIFSVFGTTMATFCGQNMGAGQTERIKEGIKKTILYAWIWCGGVIAVTHLAGPVLVYAVTGTHDSEVIKNATAYLKFDTTFYFVTAVIIIVRNAMQGIGIYLVPLFSSGIELVGKVIIAATLVPFMQYQGVIIAEPIVWFVMVIPLIVQILRTPLLKIDYLKQRV